MMTGTTRRNFVKAAAVLPMASVAGLGSAAPVDAAPVAAVTPYTSYPWQWFVSHDGEVYHDCFDTMAEAVSYAKQCNYGIVAECRQQDYRLDIDSYEILERLNLNNEELVGEGDGIICTDAQAVDLEKMVEAAIEAWVVKHKIDIISWSFGEVRNKTKIAVRT